MLDFFADVLTNRFSNFDVDSSSNIVLDLVPFHAIPIFSYCPVFSWFLRDSFAALAADALFTLGRDDSPNHSPSASHSLFSLLSYPGNFRTFNYFLRLGCQLSLFLPLVNNSTALFTLDRDISLDHSPSSSSLFFLLSLSNSTYDW